MSNPHDSDLEITVRPSLLGLKVAVATAVGTLALGGVAAAATGALPGPLHLADDPSQSGEPTLSADPSSTDSADPGESSDPSESSDPTESAGPNASASAGGSWSPTKGPNPLGPAAWGLCHAFGNKTWGNGSGSTATPDPAGRKPHNPSAAYANLVAAAASLGLTVDQYCTAVLTGQPPTAPASPSPAPSGVVDGPGHSGSHGHGHGHGHSDGNRGHGHHKP
jgi:hypothetical protein